MFDDNILMLKMEKTTRGKTRIDSNKWRILVFSSSLQPLVLTTPFPFLVM